MSAARLFLFIYLNATLSTLLPIVADVAAHLFWPHEHFEHVHHGQAEHRHVGAEMVRLTASNSAQPDADSPHTANPALKTSLSAHLPPLPVPLAKPLSANTDRAHFPQQACLYWETFLPVLSPPPERG